MKVSIILLIEDIGLSLTYPGELPCQLSPIRINRNTVTMQRIDVIHPEEKDIPMLLALFQQTDEYDQARQAWYKSKSYYVLTCVQICLTHTIIKRPSKHGGHRYEVIDFNPLGKGTYGVVYPIVVTIKITDSNLIIKQKPYGKRRVVKEYPYSPTNMDNAVAEYIMANMTSHSHPKYPVAYERSIYSVSRRMEGRDLLSIINDDLAGKSVLTLKQRYKLSLRLLEALQTQVFNAGLVHRDLKPENIIVDIAKNSVGVIDFGLAKIGEETVKNDAVGSSFYISPEVYLRKGTTKLSDVYAMGRILALLWHIELSSYQRGLRKEQILNFARKNNYSKLFRGIYKLNLQSAAIIRRTIEQMTAFDPSNRIDIQESLTKFRTAENKQFLPVATSTEEILLSPEPQKTLETKVSKESGEDGASTLMAVKEEKKLSFFFGTATKGEALVKISPPEENEGLLL
ncbi:protein kinase domain-containing protein [Legionella jamestowniensis]|uniref:Ser/Thr protein kinase n=1 Tax=Legionella jamestowniensis TaxID=455 RepID=A0A0W0UHN0_9GAMM|nr:protein kinase [Legionella jamestowniensis]KTD07165.1 Ser/Thr protein kinase [Legionella jamestowniensis]SFL71804.1 Protein kinase domain-containing protein [Legionella jamestowniensis DSM 19215]